MDERERILELVREGVLSVDEALDLLENVAKKESKQTEKREFTSERPADFGPFVDEDPFVEEEPFVDEESEEPKEPKEPVEPEDFESFDQDRKSTRLNSSHVAS